jgi:hypothetical protein
MLLFYIFVSVKLIQMWPDFVIISSSFLYISLFLHFVLTANWVCQLMMALHDGHILWVIRDKTFLNISLSDSCLMTCRWLTNFGAQHLTWNLIVTCLIKKLSFMEPGSSLPCLWKSTIGPCLKPFLPSHHTHTQFSQDPISWHHVCNSISQLKFCVNFSFLWCM